MCKVEFFKYIIIINTIHSDRFEIPIQLIPATKFDRCVYVARFKLQIAELNTKSLRFSYHGVFSVIFGDELIRSHQPGMKFRYLTILCAKSEPLRPCIWQHLLPITWDIRTKLKVNWEWCHVVVGCSKLVYYFLFLIIWWRILREFWPIWQSDNRQRNVTNPTFRLFWHSENRFIAKD